MRTEAESCAHESARLEQAAAKLHGLSVELDGRRRDLLETRKAAAAEHACKRCGLVVRGNEGHFVPWCVIVRLAIFSMKTTKALLRKAFNTLEFCI